LKDFAEGKDTDMSALTALFDIDLEALIQMMNKAATFLSSNKDSIMDELKTIDFPLKSLVLSYAE
jgi:hypothetical protein